MIRGGRDRIRYYLPTRTQSKGEFITAMVGGEQRGRERSELCDDYLGSSAFPYEDRGSRAAERQGEEAGRLNRAFCVGEAGAEAVVR
jgi:hypothetical protein